MPSKPDKFGGVMARIHVTTHDEILRRGKASYGDTFDDVLRRALGLEIIPRHHGRRTDLRIERG